MKFEHPLRLVSQRILQEWAMMLLDEPPESLALFDDSVELLKSEVRLKGEIEGSLMVVSSAEFASQLALNLLGTEEAEFDLAFASVDALKEMVNVLAGNFVTEAFGNEAVFDLLDLNVTKISREDLANFFESKIIFCFLADGLPVAVSFNIKA